VIKAIVISSTEVNLEIQIRRISLGHPIY